MVPGLNLPVTGCGELFNTFAYLTRLLWIPSCAGSRCGGQTETLLHMCVYMYIIYTTNIYIYVTGMYLAEQALYNTYYTPDI